MSRLVKVGLSTVLLLAAYLGYVYSKGVYVENETIQCDRVDDRFSNGIENAYQYPVKCEVSFKITNLTGRALEANYLVKNVTMSGQSKYGRSVSWNFKEKGQIELEPNESKNIYLVVGTIRPVNSIRVDTWIN